MMEEEWGSGHLSRIQLYIYKVLKWHIVFYAKKKREKRLQKTKNIKRTWYTLGIFHNKDSKSQVIQVQAWGIKAGESHQTSAFLVPHHKICGRSMVLGPDIPALGKLRWEDCHRFEARLHHRVYIISKQKQTAKQVRQWHSGQTYSPNTQEVEAESPRPAWAT